MVPLPESERPKPEGRLENKRALITGGDSGIGRAVAIAFAKEGCDIASVYFDEHEDAEDTKREVEAEGRKCVLIPGDLEDPEFCRSSVDEASKSLGGLDILVNNAAWQQPQEDFLAITQEQLEKTFRTNLYPMFYMTQAALPHFGEHGCVINTTSVTAYAGSAHLIDYSATKGAIVAFTRSLSQNLADKGVRVNAVAPGPIWTPLIPASFEADHVAEFGADVPLKRPGQPSEVAPSFVFLACDDSSYMTGQVLHPNGGEIVNS